MAGSATTRFRTITEVFVPDKWWEHVAVFDEGGPRQKTLDDHYQAIDRFELNQAVPEDVRVHFDTAKNVLLYAWYVHRFVSVAEAQAYASLELALRIRLEILREEEHKSTLSKLLKTAIDRRLLLDHGLRHVQRLKEQWRGSDAPEEMDGAHNTDFMRILQETFPKLRNHWAHGSVSLTGSHYFTLELCCDLINQLFPEEPTKEQG